MIKTRDQKQLFKQYGVKPNKRLGQNFLIDDSILKKIITAAELSPSDTVLEIGPGLGILTVELAKRAKKVIAIEKDGALVKISGEGKLASGERKKDGVPQTDGKSPAPEGGSK